MPAWLDLAWVRGQAAQSAPDAKPAAQPLAAALPSVPSVGTFTPQQLQARPDAAAADKAGKCLFDDDLVQDEEAHKVFDHTAGPRAAPGVADRLRVRCAARHPDTIRLCPCVSKGKH